MPVKENKMDCENMCWFQNILAKRTSCTLNKFIYLQIWSDQENHQCVAKNSTSFYSPVRFPYRQLSQYQEGFQKNEFMVSGSPTDAVPF